jgi:hypothetical protein
MPQCQFPVSAVLVFRKATQEYSRNWTKQKPKFLFFPKHDGVQSWDGGEPGGGHATPWRPPPQAAPGPGVGPCPPLDAALLPIYSPRRENLKGLINFPQNILQAVAIVDARLGGSISSSRHPAGEGNHCQRPFLSPCLPPEWCLSSLLIRLKCIYNFWCSMLVYTPFALCFLTLHGVFMHFPELTY